MTLDEEAPAAIDARSELERLQALPLDQRAGALTETVRRLEAELDATEASRASRTGPAGN
jgi:uncharacterized small protein (DUF1192 family)